MSRVSPRPHSLRYPRVLRWLHWLVALALVPQWLLGWLADATTDRGAAARLLQAHVTLGVVLCATVLLRLGLRMTSRLPASTRHRWHDAAATMVHGTLYLILLLLPASGYVIHTWMDDAVDVGGVLRIPRLFTPPSDDETWRAIAWYVHNVCAWALGALVAAHVAAACWHEARERGWIRQRMF